MKMRNTIWLVAVAVGLLMSVSLASAAVVTLPNETQSTTFTATVSEQANVSVPVAVAFAVTDVSSNTDAAAASVGATVIVLTNLNALKISLAGDTADFSKPTGGTNTWAASDVSWDVATWSNTGVGNAASLSATAATYTEVASSSANAASCESTNLIFTLAADATVDRAGDHTLAATWKFESFTPTP